MLRSWQIVVCVALAALFWLAATLGIRLAPATVAPGWLGDLGFVTSVPVGAFCVWLVVRAARLAPPQIAPGALVVLGAAMLADGFALRWHPDVYGVDDRIARTAAAWLLWGYGISAAIACAVAERRLR